MLNDGSAILTYTHAHTHTHTHINTYMHTQAIVGGESVLNDGSAIVLTTLCLEILAVCECVCKCV